MQQPEIQRERSSSGLWRLWSGDCSFEYARPRPGVLCVTILGHDTGQLGSSPLDEIRAELDRHAPLDLFVDAHDGLATSSVVFDEWREFLARSRARLAAVWILVGSKYMKLTVAIAQQLSGTRGLVRIETQRDAFAAALAKAVRRR